MATATNSESSGADGFGVGGKTPQGYVKQLKERGEGERLEEEAEGKAGTNEGVGGKMGMETPKSLSSVVGVGACEAGGKKRARSWEAERRWEGRSRVGMKPFDVREWWCSGEGRCEWCSLPDLCSGSSGGSRPREDEGGMPRTLCRWAFPCRRKGRSRKRDVARREGSLCSGADVRKVKRSLRLLGLELSDFGIYCGEEERSGGRKARERCGTFRTRVAGRSVSLEWLRESVRRAWAQDGLDESHRRLLAQAAYEEWYFRKERELRKKREGERLSSAEAGGRLREEMERKKEKSEEEFDKWLERKKRKGREKEESGGKGEGKPLGILMKSREEIEEAFLKWKAGKDEELKKRRRERKREEEKKKDLERQKAEKKAAAEKVFLQWKSKLEEDEKAEGEKRQKKKNRKEEIERKRRGKENAISFEVWKEAKEHQIRGKMKQMREAERAEREGRLAQMEERMYEAEQAFEDWLEKVDSRKLKQFGIVTTYQKPIPWIPA